MLKTRQFLENFEEFLIILLKMSQFCQKFVKIVKNLAELLFKISPFEKKLEFFCVFGSIFAENRKILRRITEKNEFYAGYTIFG